MENHNQLPGLEPNSRGKNTVFPEIRRLFTKVGLGPTHLWNAVEGLASSTKKEIGTDTKTDTGKISEKRGKSESIENTGAGNGIRTRDPRLGKAICNLFCCWMFFCYPLFSLIFCFSVLLLFPLCCSLSVPNLSQNFLRKVAVFMGDYVLPILKRNRDLQGKTDCKIDISWPRINKTETRFPYIRNKMLSPYLLSSSERLSSPSSLVIGK